MNFKTLLFVPLIVGGIHVACYGLLAGLAWYPYFVDFEIVVFKTLSVLGFVLAAAAFKKGEHLRRGWMLLAGSMFLYDINDILFRLLMPSISAELVPTIFQAIFLVVGNLAFIFGMWTLAKTWHSAGMEYSGSKFKLGLILVGVVALVVFLVAPAVMESFMALIRGDIGSATVLNIVSGAGDTVALSMVAPILFTAHSLRGGLLRWPWIFMTLVLLSWLGFDAMFSWGQSFGLSGLSLRCAFEFFRVLACMFGVSAGLAQWIVSRQIMASRTESFKIDPDSAYLEKDAHLLRA